MFGTQAQQVVDIVRELPATAGALKVAASRPLAGSSLLSGKAGSDDLTLPPRTALNASVTAGRAFACCTLPLQEAKELGRVHGATLNGLVLMLASSALRRHYTKPRKGPVAAVLITLLAKLDTEADNQASLSLVSLGTHMPTYCSGLLTTGWQRRR